MIRILQWPVAVQRLGLWKTKNFSRGAMKWLHAGLHCHGFRVTAVPVMGLGVATVFVILLWDSETFCSTWGYWVVLNRAQ